jgi:hypothetical protein
MKLENFSQRFQDVADRFAESGTCVTTQRFFDCHPMKGIDMNNNRSASDNRRAFCELSRSLRAAFALTLGATLLSTGTNAHAAAPIQSAEVQAARAQHAMLDANAQLSLNLRAAFERSLSITLPVTNVAADAAAPDQSVEIQVAREQQTLLHADAIEAFLSRRYSAAYGRFAQLADEGHVPSALIALMMVRQGPSMFGARWAVTPEQLQRWSALAASDLREHGAEIAENGSGD